MQFILVLSKRVYGGIYLMTWCFVAGRSRTRSRSVSRRRGASRSPDTVVLQKSPNRPRDSAVSNLPLLPKDAGEMLTRDVFERLQHSLRMESGLPPPSHPAFSPPLPPSIPVQHPPRLVYPVPAAGPPVVPPGQHFPPPATVMLPPQPVIMPVREQPRLYPGPSVQPPMQLVPPPRQAYPQFVVPPRAPLAQPLGPPRPPAVDPPGIRPPVMFPLGASPRPVVVLPPGNPQLPVQPPAPDFVHLQPR